MVPDNVVNNNHDKKFKKILSFYLNFAIQLKLECVCLY